MHMHAHTIKDGVCACDFCLASWEAISVDWEGGFMSGPAPGCVKPFRDPSVLQHLLQTRYRPEP